MSGFGALEPSGHQANKSKKKKKPTKVPPPAVQALDEYDRIVAAIAREPTALPEALRRQWPRAMAACESAITLRAHVAQFFPPKAGDDPHMHFLQRLVTWFQTLRDANANINCMGNGTDSRQGEPTNFANYYDVLDLPDDFFDDIAEEFEATTINTPAVSPSERKRLSEEPFGDDAVLELAYFLLELDELVEAVYLVFCDVKRQQKTLVEATIVTDIAVDFARRVVAQFQLHYPHVRNAMDLKTMLLQSTPVEHAYALTNKVYAAWNPTNSVGVGKMPPTYVRGTILLDLLWVADCLGTFSTAIPDRPTDLLVVTEGANGETFSEELTPHYTIPGFRPPMAFFLQQLPLLYNEMVESRQHGADLDALGFSDFFTTREASIDVAFVCVCWVRAVSALQGDGGLGRTVSLSVTHRWHLEERLRGSLKKDDDAPLAEDQKIVLSVLKYSDRLTSLTRANPLVAGGLLMTNHLNYLHVGTEVSLATTRLRALCHIYSALKDRQLLEAIPLLDDLITLYEPALFTPSHAAATQGSFMRVYQSSCSEKARRPKKHNSKHHAEDRMCRCLFSSSKVLQLLSDHDYSVLPTALASSTASWKAQLRGISELCTHELFGSRVLSRDLLQLSDQGRGQFTMGTVAIGAAPRGH